MATCARGVHTHLALEVTFQKQGGVQRYSAVRPVHAAHGLLAMPLAPRRVGDVPDDRDVAAIVSDTGYLTVCCEESIQKKTKKQQTSA